MMRFENLNLRVGEMESGPLRRISDVPGVTVILYRIPAAWAQNIVPAPKK